MRMLPRVGGADGGNGSDADTCGRIHGVDGHELVCDLLDVFLRNL